MKKTIFILAILSLVLAGCGATKGINDTPTVEHTNAHARSTSTPEPTATPTPEPTPTFTPTPTPEPTMMPLSAIIEEKKLDYLKLLMDVEVMEQEGGYYRWAIGVSNAILDRWEIVGDYPYVYLRRAKSYALLGDFESAIQELETAAQLTYVDQFKRSEADSSADFEEMTQYLVDSDQIGAIYNNLCWYLAITNQPERALPYCEEAVALSPSDASKIDSRAVVYAMLGRTEEAVAEFEKVLAFAEDDPNLYSDLVESRSEWVTALNNGEDPFTPEMLESLQMESVDPYAYSPPELLEDYSSRHFKQILIRDGFILVDSGVADSGIQYESYGLQFDACTNFVNLYIYEGQVRFTEMALVGCTEEQFIAEMRWYTKLIFMADPWEDMDCIALGEWYAWEVTDLRDLVAGEIDQTVRFSVRGVKFEAEREESLDYGTTIIISGR